MKILCFYVSLEKRKAVAKGNSNCIGSLYAFSRRQFVAQSLDFNFAVRKKGLEYQVMKALILI